MKTKYNSKYCFWCDLPFGDNLTECPLCGKNDDIEYSCILNEYDKAYSTGAWLQLIGKPKDGKLIYLESEGAWKMAKAKGIRANNLVGFSGSDRKGKTNN